MRSKTSLILMSLFIVTFVFGSVAMAFQDLPEGEDRDKIMSLKDLNVIKGIQDEMFAPDESLTYAQALQLIVRAFDLNIDDTSLSANELYSRVADDAWYAQAFIIAFHYGIELPEDVDPTANISREEFAHLLWSGMNTNADFIMIMIYIVVGDENDVSENYMNSVQALLISEIMSLDSDNEFHPLQEVTRYDAAIYLHDAMVYTHEYGLDVNELHPPVDEEVTVNVSEVNEGIQEVTISWGEKPTSGYGIAIDYIDFDHVHQIANVHYTLHYPDEDRMYLQVITYPTASTYVSSLYDVDAHQSWAKK